MAFDSGGGGHAVLLMRSGTFPTLLEQDFTFSAEQYAKGPQARKKSGRTCALPPGGCCALVLGGCLLNAS